MAIRICDMHSHILPGIDDGAQDMEETMQTLREAYQQGIRAIIATPHYYPEKYETDGVTIQRLCQQVKERCREEGLGLRLYTGQECFGYSGLVEKLSRGEALTIAGSRYVLTEFAPDCPYTQLQQILTQLQQGGYHPILAHFERYECLEREERILELKNRGVLLQMNFGTFLKKKGWFGKTIWQKMMQDGIVDLVGSDCHGTHYRPYHADEAVRWIQKNVDRKVQRQILATNVQKILRKE